MSILNDIYYIEERLESIKERQQRGDNCDEIIRFFLRDSLPAVLDRIKRGMIYFERDLKVCEFLFIPTLEITESTN